MRFKIEKNDFMTAMKSFFSSKQQNLCFMSYFEDFNNGNLYKSQENRQKNLCDFYSCLFKEQKNARKSQQKTKSFRFLRRGYLCHSQTSTYNPKKMLGHHLAQKPSDDRHRPQKHNFFYRVFKLL